MHQTITRQLGYAAFGLTLTVALLAGFASLARADTATSTTGTTTVSYVFDAALSPANQVPVASASTTGQTTMWFDMTTATGSTATTTNMWYKMTLQNADHVFAAHLHCGLPGQTGPVVANLYNVATTSAVSGSGTLVGTSSLTQSMLNATSTGCSMSIMNLSDLADAMRAGIIYSNVHSIAYPNGVARGQMTLTSQNSSSTSASTPGTTGNCPTDIHGWYDGNNVWHSCDSTGGTGGMNTCTATSTSNSGWYDNGNSWHWCNTKGGNGYNFPTLPTVPTLPTLPTLPILPSLPNTGNGGTSGNNWNSNSWDNNDSWSNNWNNGNNGNNFPNGFGGMFGNLSSMLANCQNMLNTMFP